MATTQGDVTQAVEAAVDALLHPTLSEVTYEFHGADQHPWTVVHLRAHEGLSALYECTLIFSGGVESKSPR